MSIFQRYADRPWAQPPMYTNQSDPSNDAGRHTVGDTEDRLAGIHVERDGRSTLPGLGDGRPDPAMADSSPMLYRNGDANTELDVDDHDFLDETPQEHVPASASVPLPHFSPPEKQAVEAPRNTNRADGLPMLEVDMNSVTMTSGSGPLAIVCVNGMLLHARAAEMEQAATFFNVWAKMLSSKIKA